MRPRQEILIRTMRQAHQAKWGRYKNASVWLMCVGALSKAACNACNFNWFLFTPGQAQSTQPFVMTLGLLKILWGRHPHRQPASQCHPKAPKSQGCVRTGSDQVHKTTEQAHLRTCTFPVWDNTRRPNIGASTPHMYPPVNHASGRQ